MDITKVRELNDDQILVELTTARRHLYDLRFQLATRQLTDFSQIAQTRKTIARLLTVQTERGVAEPAPARERASRTKTAVAGGKR
jgi:large subunit ribosomal protein L29